MHAVFQEVSANTRARGLPAVESPFQYGLRADLLVDRDGREPMTSGTPDADGEGGGTTANAAAGSGRRFEAARFRGARDRSAKPQAGGAVHIDGRGLGLAAL